jgi:predicted nucleotidyltransferase component of viral defense system
VLATADFLSLNEIYVEKDYWVTLALYEIFHSTMAGEVVFKGGTALSKCFKLIERFSEDIDLVVLRHKGETENQLKKKIRAISKVVQNVIPEIKVDGLTNKKGNIRKTVHQHHQVFEGDFGQVRENVVVEATWLGNFEPYSEMPIGTYIYEMMLSRRQTGLIEKYDMDLFNIQVLSKFRTFCEKILSLVRFSKTETPIADLRNKIRHIYDIHQMLKDNDVSGFFGNKDFDEMLVKVGNDDMISYNPKSASLPPQNC